ncbi:MAG: nicotinate-nucleotide--dimethylbenzimidazole phosphoribosyltransferase [Victivallaceae bacterium]
MNQRLQSVIEHIPGSDAAWRRQALTHVLKLAMPQYALGRLLDVGIELAGIQRTLNISVKRKKLFLLAGDHGVVSEGVTCQPQSITLAAVRNFVIGGGAAINVLSDSVKCDLVVADFGINGDVSDLVEKNLVEDCKIGPGTGNLARQPAMSHAQAEESILRGIELFNRHGRDLDLAAIGEMGIGNTTPSSAIVAAISGVDAAKLVDRGAGLAVAELPKKVLAIKSGLARLSADADGIEILSQVGGFEIGGMCGVILGAAAMGKAVMIDGFIATAAALLAMKFAPRAVDYMILSHGSVEQGHQVAFQLLQHEPLLNLNLRLGEGSGAVLAMPLLDAACAIMTQMNTFDETAISSEGIINK